MVCGAGSLAAANAGKGGTVHKVGDGFDLGQIGGVLDLDESELVDALDVERLSVLELAVQEHLFFFRVGASCERARKHTWMDSGGGGGGYVRVPMPFPATLSHHTW